jgi:hypothetical protein
VPPYIAGHGRPLTTWLSCPDHEEDLQWRPASVPTSVSRCAQWPHSTFWDWSEIEQSQTPSELWREGGSLPTHPHHPLQFAPFGVT